MCLKTPVFGFSEQKKIFFNLTRVLPAGAKTQLFKTLQISINFLSDKGPSFLGQSWTITDVWHVLLYQNLCKKFHERDTNSNCT